MAPSLSEFKEQCSSLHDLGLGSPDEQGVGLDDPYGSLPTSDVFYLTSKVTCSLAAQVCLYIQTI